MFFGKKGQKNTKNPEQSIQEQLGLLEGCIQQQEKRLDFLQSQADACYRQAIEAQRHGQKSKAISKMKERMQKEKNIQRTSGYLDNLRTMKGRIEEASSMQDTMKAFEIGNEALKTIMSQTNMDKIDQIQDEINENMESLDERQDALATPFSGGISNEEAEAALEDALQMELDQQMADAPVPTQPLPAHQNAATAAQPTTAEQDQMQQLEGMLA